MIAALGIGSWILIGSVFRSLGGEPRMELRQPTLEDAYVALVSS